MTTPMRVTLTFAVVLTALCAVGCVHRGFTYNPFLIPADSLFEQMKTLVVAPVTATGDLEVPEDAAAKLEAAIEERLGQAGFDIVPVFEYIGTWQHIADGYGGFYDSFTGDRNDVAFAAATDSLRSELRNRFDADGLFIPELWDGMAPFEWGVAKWDGATQEVFGAFPLSGEVRALSLVVHIEDLSGREFVHQRFRLRHDRGVAQL